MMEKTVEAFKYLKNLRKITEVAPHLNVESFNKRKNHPLIYAV